MMHELPPEAYAMSQAEIMDLCAFDGHKLLGSITVSSDEPMPADGLDPTDGRLVVYKFSPQVILHLNSVSGAQQLRHSGVLAASYVGLHPVLREREFVVGITYKRLGELMVRMFGFSAANPSQMEEEFSDRLKMNYEALPMSEREALQPAMIYMRTDQFVDRYAARQLGGDVRMLAAMAGWKAMVSGQSHETSIPADSLLAAIEEVIRTMPGDSEA